MVDFTNEAISIISKEVNISSNSVASALDLIVKKGCTIPFISRYRKEATNGLDEVQLRNIQDAYNGHIELEKRRSFILDAITKIKKMTPELKENIVKAKTSTALEDIYAPFKSKRKTKGQMAQEAGLSPLAEILLCDTSNLNQIEKKYKQKFINKDHKVTSWEECLSGVRYILMEKFSHNIKIKEKLRKDYWNSATLVSTKKKKAEEIKDWSKFKDYFDYEQKVSELKEAKSGHRYLAMRRGMSSGVLKVDVCYNLEDSCKVVESFYYPIEKNLGATDFLKEAAKKAISLYIHPSIDLEIKSELKRLADESAILVFKENLKNLLLQPYLGSHSVLAIDPGIRTGCKVVVIGNTGSLIEDCVIYPHGKESKIQESLKILTFLIDKYKIKYIAIGNGTFGRETLNFIEDQVSKVKDGYVKATLVSESGASIYSASDIARQEFPDKDVTVRGAVNIARRFQDPLAELVKLDPKSIGIGQYQHDVNQVKLKRCLNGVVEDCVNHVGVDINTASAPLLSFISGIGPVMAKNIVSYRHKNGKFTKREELLTVPRLSESVFLQSAGFLKIYNGTNPLDSTFIHPEQYETILNWTLRNETNVSELIKNDDQINSFLSDNSVTKTIGKFTLKDIASNLKSPGQDPRVEFKSTDFRKDARTINELKLNEWYPGVVTNITKFGAFVDIGIKENGLLHISQMSDHFISNPLDELKVGQEIKAKIIEVDIERKRIALSRKTDAKAQYCPGPINREREKSNSSKNNLFSSLKNLKLSDK